MNKRQVIEHLKSKGADVFVKKFGVQGEKICVHLGKIKDTDHLDLHLWKHGVYLILSDYSWFIGYSQFGLSRALTEKEMLDVMEQWIENPCNEVLAKYQAV